MPRRGWTELPRRGWPEAPGGRPKSPGSDWPEAPEGLSEIAPEGLAAGIKSPRGLAEAGGFYPKKGASIRGKRL